MKNVFGLVVAGATLAGVIGSASPAGAVIYNYNGTNYDVKTYSGTFESLQSTLTAAENLVWNNYELAKGLADTVGTSLGLVTYDELIVSTISKDSKWGPLFAYGYNCTTVSREGYSECDSGSASPYGNLWAAAPQWQPLLPDYCGELGACWMGHNYWGPYEKLGEPVNPLYQPIQKTSLVYATATAVPWDISGSATILGSITGIGLGVGLKRLKSKKNIKE